LLDVVAAFTTDEFGSVLVRLGYNTAERAMVKTTK